MLKEVNEVTPNTLTVTGTTILTFNNDTKKFTAVTTYNCLTPTTGL